MPKPVWIHSLPALASWVLRLQVCAATPGMSFQLGFYFMCLDEYVCMYVYLSIYLYVYLSTTCVCVSGAGDQNKMSDPWNWRYYRWL